MGRLKDWILFYSSVISYLLMSISFLIMPVDFSEMGFQSITNDEEEV